MPANVPCNMSCYKYVVCRNCIASQYVAVCCSVLSRQFWVFLFVLELSHFRMSVLQCVAV